MLTSITIQNFKGIGDPVTIPIRPLTIMFGKNSAGKSTLIHAFHYAREVLMNDNPDADKTSLGGGSIDLGGFRSLVHNHQYLDRAIRMKFEFDITLREFPEYIYWDPLYEHAGATVVHVRPGENSSGLDLIREHQGKNLYNEIQKVQEKIPDDESLSTSVEFTVRWSETLEAPVITNYRTWIFDEEAARITTSPDRKNVDWEINLNHSLLLSDEVKERSGSEGDPIGVNWLRIPPVTDGQFPGSLPRWGRPIYLSFSVLEELSIGFNTVSQLFTGPGDLLVGFLQEPGLRDFRYIGPIRETPARNFAPQNSQDEDLWANGSAAWTALYRNQDDLVNSVSDWLSSEKLKTGYTVDITRFRELPLDSDLSLALQLGNLIDRIDDTTEEIKKYPIRSKLKVVDEKSGIKLDPFDIGVGISQIIPVVVAAVMSEHQIVAIEQPELHLHPAVQAELGDLFITFARKQDNVFILETHSEHLILRILRRIRETTAGKDTGNSAKVDTDDLSLLFVGEGSSGDGSDFLPLRVDKRGRITDRIPGGFFEEDFAEIL